jgi:hypothetical protein
LDYAYRSGSSPVVFAKSLIAKAPQVPAAPPVQPQAIPPFSSYQLQTKPQQSTRLVRPSIQGAVAAIILLLLLVNALYHIMMASAGFFIFWFRWFW